MPRPNAHADVGEWRQRIDQAKAYQESTGRLERWRTFRDWYENRYPPGVVSVNLLFAIGRALVPQLYFKTPRVLVQPQPGRQQPPNIGQWARQLEAVDAWLIRRMGLKQQLKLGITDAYLTNILVLKVGYHSLGVEVPTHDDPAPSQDLGTAAQEVLAELGIDVPAEEPQEDEEQVEHTHHDLIHPDEPWALRVRPEDLLVPDGWLDVSSLPWCAFRVRRPLEDVQADPVYSHTKNLQPSSEPPPRSRGRIRSPQDLNKGSGAGQGAPSKDEITLWEIWDRRDSRIRVLPDSDADKWLRNDRYTLPGFGLPLILGHFNPVGWDFWGPSDAQETQQLQMEYNETRTLEMLHKRTAITKFIYDKNKIDDPEIVKFTRGEQVAIASDGPPGDSVQQLVPQMSPDLFRVSEVIRQDIREVVGFGRNQLGESERPASRRTKAEALIIQQNVQLRSDERRDIIADLIADLFQQKIHPLIFSQWTTERAFEVSGQPGWQPVNVSAIKGDYLVEVIADSVLPLSRQIRQQLAVQAFGLLRQDPFVEQYELRKWLLEVFEGTVPDKVLKSREQITQDQQQQMQTAMIQSLVAGGAGALAKAGAKPGGNGGAGGPP